MAHFKNPLPLRRRPPAELITIGTELLTGSVVNTNAAYLGRELTKLGFKVHWQSACRDEGRAIQEVLRRALERSEVVIVSGGLGPTPDDLTRESLAQFFKVPLTFSRVQYRIILRHYRKRGKRTPSLVKREAYFPANSKPLLNRFGIALGFLIEKEGRFVIVLPGVPGELVRLFESRLKPFLKKNFPRLHPPASLVVKTVGLSEPTIMKRLGSSFFKMGEFEFGIYPEIGEVALRLYGGSPALIRRLKEKIRKAMGKDIYSFSEEGLESVIGKKLRARRWTLSLAESCTGGKGAGRITRVPGASRYFLGGIVAYRGQIKTLALEVPPSLLEKKGAVSPETAFAMARGVRRQFASTFGLSITGIAGPGGGSTGKPVGLVYLAIASRKGGKVWKEYFTGDREEIRARAVKKSLEYLWRWLKKQDTVSS